MATNQKVIFNTAGSENIRFLKYPKKVLNTKRFPMFTITHDFFDGKIRKKGIIHQIRSRWDITVATVNEKQIFIQFLVKTKRNFIKNQIVKFLRLSKKILKFS